MCGWMCVGGCVSVLVYVDRNICYMCMRSRGLSVNKCRDGASACDDVTETLMPPIARSSRGTLTLHMPILRHFLHFRPADLLLYETLVALGGPCSRKWVLIRSFLSPSVVFQWQGAQISLFPLYAKDLSHSCYEWGQKYHVIHVLLLGFPHNEMRNRFNKSQ